MANNGAMIGIVAFATVLGGGLLYYRTSDEVPGGAANMFIDGQDGDNWPGFGNTYGEQHYSSLTQVNSANVRQLGLVWSLDLENGNSATGPIAVDGVIYLATGYSIVHAIDAVSGKLLWKYDPEVPIAAGNKLRLAWGIRGLAWWNGKVIVGTHDGRLIALDAKAGKPVWTAQTLEPDDKRFISGAPRVFDGKVVIGNGGADVGPMRGYVTTFDADTGKKLWQFYTVPGNPALGFENDAMRMAAATWSGEWWKFGGGGSVWNAMSYDRETETLFLGTGNGFPWNHKIRSQGKGDNLFLCSIVALDAKTGKYKWHYQYNPGESWDYNGAMDMELAELTIEGKLRKVIMSAPKNGFFYVIDRVSGKLISAQPITKVNWASRIDLGSGRPVENPDARYPRGKPFTMWPGGLFGAHGWVPMAYNAKARLVFVPVMEMGMTYSDNGIDLNRWRPIDGHVSNAGVNIQPATAPVSSHLLAWDPATQKEVWRADTPSLLNGGVMTTAGNLVFQGQVDGLFRSYAADSGKPLWSYQAQSAVIAPPITYRVNGKQYVTIITGNGTTAAMVGPLLQGRSIDYHTQARRVLTFALGGNAQLPSAIPFQLRAAPDPAYRVDGPRERRGAQVYMDHCVACHGFDAVAQGAAPDLRGSSVPQSADAFASVVRDGALVRQGMPRFAELNEIDLAALSQFLRAKARQLSTTTRNSAHESTSRR